MLNMDRSTNLFIDVESMHWQESPHPGVLRKPLEREAAEHGWVTSVVKYLPGASFHGHEHPKGEEILVLDGTFSDENGHYPAGSYLRNPPGSSHVPFSDHGCVLFVKLNQMQASDTTQLALPLLEQSWTQLSEGVTELELYTHNDERVSLVSVDAGASLPLAAQDFGEELFLLKGNIKIGERFMRAFSWIRMARDQVAGHAQHDCLLWRKTGSLGRYFTDAPTSA
nr:cupin domain-containing protein [Aliagarivorans taiwanensis]